MSSIFGNSTTSAQSQPAQTSNLFGSVQSQSTTTGTQGSLFDRVTPATQSTNPSSTGTGGGLFDRVTPATQSTTQPSTGAGGGIFDRVQPATSQPQQGSSLFQNFQNLGGQSKPTSSGSVFDTSKPQQSGASNSTAANPFLQSTATSGLFGNTTQQSSNQPASSSIFAPQSSQTQNQSQQQQQGSISTQRPQPGYFDNLIEKGRKRTRDGEQGPGFQNLPSLQLGLGDISKRVRELGGAASQPRGRRENDSRAHYLLAASGVNAGATRRDLDSLGAQDSFTNSTVTKLTDFDPDNKKYVEQLEQRLTTRMVQEGLERAQRRFDEYLEENVDINWEQQRKRIYEHFGLTPREPETDELGGSVGKGSFGHSARRSRLGKTQTPSRQNMSRSIFGQSSLQKSVIGTPGVGSSNATLFADVAEKSGMGSTGPEDRYLREKQYKYAAKVQALNEARLRKLRTISAKQEKGPTYPILSEFLSIDNEPGGDSPKQIAAAYKALIEIAKEENVPERAFADDYLDEMPNSARSIKIRKQIIDGARKSLEKEFFGQLEDLVSRNPKEASIGGIPTALSKVRAYVRIRAARKDLAPDGTDLATMGEDFCWALIFYLLRSGLVNEAAEYVVGNAAHFKTIDRNIITFLTSYARSSDRRLDGRVQRDCNNVYSAMTKTAPGDTIDPYRIACYKLIGRCELNKRTLDNVSQSVDDWIWLQFNLAREVNRAEESAADVYGLNELRETIIEIGQRHFEKGNEGLGGFGTFFHLQILGGMFEQAVTYLYSYSYTAAVHFAIALDYYGLLRVSDFSVSESELLTYNTKNLPQINFGRMIGYYTRDFRASNAEAAVDYLSLLCLNADLPGQLGKSQAGLCHEALRELVLETREFARLLGDIRSDGARIKGAIEDRLEIIALDDQEEFLKTITMQAASVADDNGRITDAVLLYHLAEEFDTVINIISRTVSEALSIDIGAERARLQPLKPRANGSESQNGASQQPAGSSLSLTAVDDPYVLGSNMMDLYSNNTMYFAKVRSSSRETCGILLRLCEIRAKVVAGQWAEAYEAIAQLHLLPLTANGNIPIIRSSSQAFNSLPSTIARNVGPILLWTITCISRQRENLSQKQFEGGVSRQMNEDLLSAAKDLMVFAGMIKLRLTEKVWEAVCNV